jgi:Mce-associated membrane protein
MTTRTEDLDVDDGIDDDAEELDDTEETDETDEKSALFTVRRVAIGLLVLAVLVAGAGGWFFYQERSLRSAPSAANTALVDTGRTAEVSAAVTTGLNRVFSYSYDKTVDTEQAASAILRGAARDAYDKLFADVRRLAPDQKLVLTTRVVSAAVQSIEGDTARVLVFLDQSATRADTGTANAAAAQLSVTAEKDGDRWVITNMEPR